MRLADFIDANVEPILSSAEAFAATMLPASSHLDAEALRDHMPMILAAVAKDLRSAQTSHEQLAKSLGQQPHIHGAPETAAQTHALLRAKAGFDIAQLVAEYRALRASVLSLWFESGKMGDAQTQDDLIRFNEAIDQAVAESVTYFTAEMDRWRHVFLGVLGHDLRGPLNAILLTAEVLSKMTTEAPLERHTVRLIQSGKRMKTLLDDLLDFSRASLGLGLSLHLTPVDLASVCAEEVELLRAALPNAEISFRSAGETAGSFDGSRVREVLGNLVSNAARYGTQKAVIDVALVGDERDVRLSVTNTGEPIPEEQVQALFEPLRRGRPSDELAESANLGLGLFIVREIAKAHGGEITVTSAGGTTVFTLMLPRSAAQ
ncbi:sensor histidine kinase [Variovorax sp. IB41]|uniref:sensor histidine kinase n=1 Tax=Variovorax sp. IB41 TaxID=2779370 RepID=UPI0018E8C239|nr:HAMP domain-containing sensor histidine kinase [Variovorax sp. IB41]MBJ2158730.1 HAMP domain-containing histidine kinase [Variovorax sp. IB41]